MSEDEMHHASTSSRTPDESLLSYSRAGDFVQTKELLRKWSEEKSISLNINCKGNHDWTPLHLACYFGHKKIVELLISHGADLNVVNDTGDTALHKASFTSREEVVLLLVSNHADVFIRNSEGQTARDISEDTDIKKLLLAAETADIEKKNATLLHAAREGNIQVIENLLKSDNPPDINCVDSLGNSSLHCAAYRGKKEVALLLLQNGIDTTLKNLRGQCAVDLAPNLPTKQLLGVQPVKPFQKVAARFEGLLLRKSRFLGWKEVWTILEKGVMSFFNSRADSTTGTRRKGYKYLDGAKPLEDESDLAAFIVIFSDNTRQRFSVGNQKKIDRQKWINSITEHIEFSSHYLKQGFSDSDPEDDDIMPVGTMQDKLQTAQAHLQVFERSIDMLKENFDEHQPISIGKGSTFYDTHETGSLYDGVENMIVSARKVSSSLSYCLTAFIQQEEIRTVQMKQQQERLRFLQDALHTLAQEHHELEKSLVSPFHSPPNSPHYEDTDCDEFFDAFEGDYSLAQNESIKDDSSSNSGTALESETTEQYASFSLSSSENTTTPVPSKWGRVTLPKPQFSRNDFSIWSILKQCIGKELSKITMPVVFNEPLSFLQRLCENIEYCNLLEKANNADDPVQRMEYVAAFAVACISSNWERLGKPFNPLLGETFEFVREEEGFRIITEQVSHHPPVTAFHADSPSFVFTGAIHPKLKLWARSVEVKPEGTVVVKLLKHNETYTWTGVTCCVHNIIVGKLWMEQCGIMEINCHTNGMVAELNFKPAGWYSKDLNCVEGFILDREKTKLRFMYGKWTSYIRSLDVQYYEAYLRLKELEPAKQGNDSRTTSTKDSSSLLNKIQKRKNASITTMDNGDKKEACDSLSELPSTLVWEADTLPDWCSEYYNFTYFAMALNEMTDTMKTELPPTDSRLRPDIRRLEEGDVDGAAFEKNRLEEKQRETRKIRKKEKTTWVPLWFESKPHPYAKEESWSFKGGYWDRNFSKSPDIF